MKSIKSLEVVRSRYQYGNTLAVMANDKDGSPYGVCTVYLEGESEKLGSDEAFVDTNNWPDLDQQLESAGLAKPIERFAQSGFCIYPAMKFDLTKIRDLRAGK